MPDDASLAPAAGNATVEPRPDALKSGTRIWTYRIGKILGQDAFSITYSARDTVAERDVAVTEYLPIEAAMRTSDLTVVARSPRWTDDFRRGRDFFLAEARSLAELAGTAGIAHVHDGLEANGTAYRVIARLRGESLATRLARHGTLPPKAIDRLLPPLLDAIEKMHDRGLLHLDIQPSNIMLDVEGRPTLTGFGATQAALAARPHAPTMLEGTRYAAVEQLSDGQSGAFTDIYGLAATLYHCVTGKAPVPAIKRLAEQLAPATQQAAGRYAHGLLNGIDTGLAFRSTDRPASIAVWRPAFEARQPAGDADTAASGLLAAVRLAAQLAPSAAAPGEAAAEPAAAPSPARHRRSRSYVSRLVARTRRDPAPAAFVGMMLLAMAIGLAGGYVLRPMQDRAEAARKSQIDRVRAEAQARRQQQDMTVVRHAAEREARADADVAILVRAAAMAAQEAAARRAAEEAGPADDAKARADVAAAAADRRQAELAESSLGLTARDRRRVQVALTALGFDTRGIDEAFGPRTRQMIALWQKRQGAPDTGFLTAAQHALLQRQATAALATYDAEEAATTRKPRRAELADTPASDRPADVKLQQQ
ncbi:serine/threonine-protein kinase [Vineibacter terrae]|uniref:serine/threonine-protein kinase n=1 Tax=Vineibacter terrae TaxID=2586908 RepID=UPI002E31978F|nr:serine/threonine-protein kinase [Vineibacter terrae]HEX2886856.1 serine/threonine-protein kinase [Vineibacter terrae]